jgi:hypothetical protein
LKKPLYSNLKTAGWKASSTSQSQTVVLVFLVSVIPSLSSCCLLVSAKTRVSQAFKALWKTVKLSSQLRNVSDILGRG